MGWNDHIPAGLDLFEEIETMIADFDDFPLTEEQQEFMAQMRDQLDETPRDLTESEEGMVSDIWETMVSYVSAVRQE